MLLRELEYARPASVADAVQLLQSRGARVLAGGQTLVNVLKLRVIEADLVVDVTRLRELQTIERTDDGLEIGAAVTYQELVESADVRSVRPVVADVASIIADQQVRNRGTIGGNVCLNLATSHFPPLLAAVRARFTIVGPAGERTVEAGDFFKTVFTTAVRPGELLTRISVSARASDEGDAFAALPVGKEGMSIMAAAASVRVDGRIEEARVALGCVAPAPVRTGELEQRLVGIMPTTDAIRAAVAGLGETLRPQSDVNASASFRRRMAEVYAARAVGNAVRDIGRVA